MRNDRLILTEDSHLSIDLGDVAAPPAPNPTLERLQRRKQDIDARQARIADILAGMACEAAVLFVPAHVAWFCGGFNVRGLLAESERPGLYTNGKQRWLLCSNLDTQRLFDEELDRLGFQVKEWPWTTGRAVMLGELTAGKRVAADRPFPNMPLLNEHLRTEIRPFSAYEREEYQHLGHLAAHAVEAVARTMNRTDTECEVAGQLAHRLTRHGVEVAGLSVAGESRSRRYPRPGLTEEPIEGAIRLQATACKDGRFVTLSRTLCFGGPSDEVRKEYDLAAKLSAVYRAHAVPDETLTQAAEAGRRLTHGTPHDYDWRLAQIGYGTGRLPAEELRRLGQDEKLVYSQALVTQAKCGRTAVVDTVLVADHGGQAVTPPSNWPFKRIKIQERTFDVPDLLVRE